MAIYFGRLSRCGRAVAHIYNEKTNDALRCVRMPVQARMSAMMTDH